MRRIYKELCEKYGLKYELNPLILEAMIMIESGQEKWATRYESRWIWFLTPIKYARLRGVTTKTERIHQSTSWGLMQVMGTVARELGFKGNLPELCQPDIGVKYGAIKLSDLLDRYKALPLALAAYNAGSPTSKAGAKYSDKVLFQFDLILKSDAHKCK